MWVASPLEIRNRRVSGARRRGTNPGVRRVVYRVPTRLEALALKPPLHRWRIAELPVGADWKELHIEVPEDEIDEVRDLVRRLAPAAEQIA